VYSRSRVNRRRTRPKTRIAEYRVAGLNTYELIAAAHPPIDAADQLNATLAEVHVALAY